MPDNPVTVTATYEPISTQKYTVTVNNGTGSGEYAKDADVTIQANPAPEGQQFKEWTGTDNLTFTNGDKTTATATFTMPDIAVNVTAVYGPNAEYSVTVSGGNGSGQYKQGETVQIEAPAYQGENAFKNWTWTGPADFTIPNSTAYSTSFVMPAGNVTVTANFSTGAGGGCYVATAVYGSYDCPEVWTLRRFRDRVLAKTWYGRLFIHLYYAVSPTAVRFFGQTQWFQDFFRSVLDPWVLDLQSEGFESTPYQDRAW